MELNDDVVDLEPGLAIRIEPGTAHRAYGDIKALIVVIPAAEHGDEFFCDDSSPASRARGQGALAPRRRVRER